MVAVLMLVGAGAMRVADRGSADFVNMQVAEAVG